MSAEPDLTPAFDRSLDDYAVRCNGVEPVMVSVDAPDGTQVFVGGAAISGSSAVVPVELDPNKRFSIRVEAGGERTWHYVRCLPGDFPAYTARRDGDAMAGWYLVTPSVSLGGGTAPYAAIFDRDGVPVWWFRLSDVFDTTHLDDQHIAIVQRGGPTFGFDPGLAYFVYRLDGKLFRQIQAVGVPTDFHELRQLPNGNYLLVAYRPRDGVDLSAYGGPAAATVLDAEIQEVTRRGELVWSWNSSDHIDLGETGRWYGLGVLSAPTVLPDGRTAYDIVHINSAEEDGDGVVFSARHVDAVYRIDRATGAVDWKLGGTPTADSLVVVGDSVPSGTTLAGQHDARVLEDGTLTVYENGTFRDRPPRALRMAIDETAGTATVLEEVVEGEAIRSFCCGGARKLAGGNWVVSWASDPLVSELTEDGTRVFRLSFGDGLLSYRAEPIRPGELDAARLRRAMDRMASAKGQGRGRSRIAGAAVVPPGTP